MTAAAANRDAKWMPGELITVGVAASTTIYKGTLVGYNATGYLEPKDASGNVFAGVAAEGAVGGDASGNVVCKVWRKGTFEFVLSGAAITANGDELYVVDDQTLATSGTHKVGRACGFPGTGIQRIDIGGYC